DLAEALLQAGADEEVGRPIGRSQILGIPEIAEIADVDIGQRHRGVPIADDAAADREVLQTGQRLEKVRPTLAPVGRRRDGEQDDGPVRGKTEALPTSLPVLRAKDVGGDSEAYLLDPRRRAVGREGRAREGGGRGRGCQEDRGGGARQEGTLLPPCR